MTSNSTNTKGGESPPTTTRPEIVEDGHLKFLDMLRDSGVTNMMGSPAYLRDAFEITKQESYKIVDYWMETFGQEER